MQYSLLLVTVLCWGLAQYLMKAAGVRLSPFAVVFGNYLGYTLAMPLVWLRVAASDKAWRVEWVWAAGVGLLFILGNLAFYRLLQTGAVARLAPLTALNVVVPVVLGVTLGREHLTPQQWAGVALAIVAGCLLAVEAPAVAPAGAATGT